MKASQTNWVCEKEGNMGEMDGDEESRDGNYQTIGIALGISLGSAIGAALGAAMGDAGTGMGLGVSFVMISGVVVGGAMSKGQSTDDISDEGFAGSP